MGEGPSLAFACGLALVAHLWFAWGALLTHRNPLPLLVSLLAWEGVLLPWWAKWRSWTPHQHEAGMYRCLAAWAITDVSVLILLWPLEVTGRNRPCPGSLPASRNKIVDSIRNKINAIQIDICLIK